MLKKSLGLAMSLILLLAGCGETNLHVAKDENNKQDIVTYDNDVAESDNNEEITTKNRSANNEKTTEVPNSIEIDEGKSFTPYLLGDASSLSTKAIPWSWLYSPRDNADLLLKYKGYGFGDTSKKIIYLTFDEGYENGYTESILNILRENNVHATFFVTKPYVTGSFNGKADTDLIKRMSNEGHIIGNHSVQHKPMNLFTSESDFNNEILGVESAINSIPGCKMSKYFRPPEGIFSELSLYYTQKLEYKSIFYALAYKDYDIDNQPDPETSKATLLKNSRDGMICLLHAVSKTNVTILDSLIKEWKNRGYEFKTLDELPN